jgi:hypothetical protein
MKHEKHHEMQDNRMVHSTRQKGIERVLQRKEDRNDVEGHHGAMSHKHRSDASFKRSGDSLTPRKA